MSVDDQTPTTPPPPPGWYPHPSMTGTQQYWDGTRWTEHVAPGSPHAATATPAAGHDGLVVAGWVTAILLPLVGFIIGVVLLSKRTNHGVAMMIVSVVATLLWANQLTASSGF